MACSLPHTDSKVEALVQRLINEDKGRQDALLELAFRMVEMINKKKKLYAEQKAKAKRSKPMTQAQQREYMSTFIKNQSSWKLSQLKKLSFEEVKLEQETSKKQKIDIEDASITKGKYEVVKEEEAKVLGDLKTMFDPPLSDDAIWSLPLQQKIINWRSTIKPVRWPSPLQAHQVLLTIRAKLEIQGYELALESLESRILGHEKNEMA
ncbi:hypothetical protein Tco_0238028 [Tanacetum coccineum]